MTIPLQFASLYDGQEVSGRPPDHRTAIYSAEETWPTLKVRAWAHRYPSADLTLQIQTNRNPNTP